MQPDRYHVTLTIEGRPLMHGWWAERAPAERKLDVWARGYGSRPGVRVVLVDEETGETLASWPDPVVGGGS